ncbi:putative F-box protein At1g67623 [Lotus japonicus]|uniref:putative F-box protein At1g67623 n=1 Tax=Lotus japonicus TaxID=34305 RepID=UPI0025851710|nr:putative F-box protein At1g67623 [Lotus japonicus]
MTSYSRLVKWARTKKRCAKRHCARKGPKSTTTIKVLPTDLLVDVVARVASNSFIDLLNLKKCSKDFLHATEDNYISQRVSLETFPLIQWIPNDKASSFLNHCRECENIESLYREGLRKYFSYSSGKNDGLEILKVAAQKGHKEAKYVYGMILICSKDDELRKQGLEHVRFLRKSKCVVSCRQKVRQLLNFMWKNHAMLEHNQSPLCSFKSTCKGWRLKTSRWALLDDDDEDEDMSLCEYCRWDHELELFYRLFNVY